MKRKTSAVLIIVIGLLIHIPLFEWKTDNTHYSMYNESVRDTRSLDRMNLLFIQLGDSQFSNEDKYQGYKRGFGIFFRPFLKTDSLKFVAVLVGITLPMMMLLIGIYLLFRPNQAESHQFLESIESKAKSVTEKLPVKKKSVNAAFNVFHSEQKHLFYIALSTLALALILDLAGFSDACLSQKCDGGSWFLGSTFASMYFIIPGIALYFFLPQKLKNRWFAVPICIILWIFWVGLRALMTGDEEFRPTLISLISLLIFFNLATTKKPAP